ncbi:MAG: ABC transporter ATP-binding protein [Candidatus Omnitrophota bacterium]
MINVKDVSKKFIISHEKDALVRAVLPLIAKPIRKEELWALKDISFSLDKGESLGIVGLNGAGKSVLLNVLAGITTPTTGTVDLKGKVSTLLSVGTGFNMELTGEENIFLNATILGMSIKEIKEKFKSIVDFSELDGFIDAPVQTYSSGMLMRLGFAVAIHMDFDILLIDEVISVGDLEFMGKCIVKLREFREKGKVLVIASQNVGFIRENTEKTLYLRRGIIEGYGDSEKITQMYENSVIRKAVVVDKHNIMASVEEKKKDEAPSMVEDSWGKISGTGEVTILDVKFYNKNKEEKNVFKTGETLQIEVKYKASKEIIDPHFGIAIFRDDKLYCYGPNTRFDNFIINKLNPVEGHFSLYYPELLLSKGTYYVSVAIWEKNEKYPYDYHCAFYKIDVDGEGIGGTLFHQGYREKIDFINSNWEDHFEIKMVDKNGKEKYAYSTEDFLKILIEMDYPKEATEIHLKILREDSISCFVVKKILKNQFFKKTSARLEFTIDQLSLLTGKYYMTVEARGKEGVLLSRKNVKEFFVFSPQKDHGILYMPHRWDWKEEVVDEATIN